MQFQNREMTYSSHDTRESQNNINEVFKKVSQLSDQELDSNIIISSDGKLGNCYRPIILNTMLLMLKHHKLFVDNLVTAFSGFVAKVFRSDPNYF